MTDAVTRSAAELTTVLRAWLRARREPPEALASAMSYEIAALVALHAGTVTDACALLDAWTETMKDQIRQLGVGVEHP
jgi:UPF0716 family protein affecting phage T7 exclusion